MSAERAGAAQAQVRRLVVKIGSSTLTNAAGQLDASYLNDLAAQARQLVDEQVELLIVSSGAIIAGLEALAMPPKRPDDVPTLQAAAAVGQIELARHYAQSFELQELRLAQILLTRADIQNRQSYLHARDTLYRLLNLGVIPLINENDTVAIDEIRFGDNDSLAAQVAMMVKADLVVLLSDIEGLYSADPRLEADAELLEQVAIFSAEIVDAAGEAGTEKGSGGMFTKIEAARMLKAASIPTVICSGRVTNALLSAARGEVRGTRFLTDGDRRQAGARKLWLALAGPIQGAVKVDAGAARALRERGGSLLAVGVREVQGEFAPGSALDIRNPEGLLIGRGLSSYSSAVLRSAAGLTSTRLTDAKLLNDQDTAIVIHRDEMVVF
ncbi:MAG: glutamate 5-kinase [Coriobacteriales bacterium]|jgi:glutamate 5-kinase|nr:glutamate 5-kinase [Coriobacteriales bacterium]